MVNFRTLLLCLALAAAVSAQGGGGPGGPGGGGGGGAPRDPPPGAEEGTGELPPLPPAEDRPAPGVGDPGDLEDFVTFFPTELEPPVDSVDYTGCASLKRAPLLAVSPHLMLAPLL